MFGWLREFFSVKGTRPPSIVFDDQGVRRDLGSGKYEQVQWSELERIEIITTDEGPFLEDVFWLLDAGDHGCVVPGEFGNQVLDQISDFSGVNHEAVIKAMGCTSNDRFLVWSDATEEDEHQNESRIDS